MNPIFEIPFVRGPHFSVKQSWMIVLAPLVVAVIGAAIVSLF